MALEDLAIRREDINGRPRPALLPTCGGNKIALGIQPHAVDAAVLETKYTFDPEDSPRDRLIGVLMRRFDAQAEDRDGVLSILAALRGDPVSALCLSAGMCESMRWMLETARIPASDPKGRLTVKGLVGLWLATLRVWERDESSDMAQTMAMLDKNLRRAERLRSMLPSSPRRSRRGPAGPPSCAELIDGIDPEGW